MPKTNRTMTISQCKQCYDSSGKPVNGTVQRPYILFLESLAIKLFSHLGMRMFCLILKFT